MAYAKLIAFDRPLSGISVVGQNQRLYTEAELSARAQESYHRGVDDARSLADQQMVESRADLEQLSDGVFRKLSTVEPVLLGQLRDSLPGLALELARRLFAGFEPSAEIVARLCEEALSELYPERENLEITLSPSDAVLLEKLNPDWLARYPGLRIRTEASLSPGDCQVRSRFGLTDARRETKLSALAHSLAPS